MKIDKLQPHITVKNYRTMCQLLGEKVKKGSSKIIQLEEWERWFDFSQDGQKFIIHNVYKQPLAKDFLDYMELLLLHELLQEQKNNYTIILPKTFLMEKLNLVNKNYPKFITRQTELATILNIPKHIIQELFALTSSSFKSKLATILKRLDDKRLVRYKLLDYVCYITDADAEFYGGIRREATTEEIKFKLRTEKLVLKGLNVEKISDLKHPTLFENFNKICISIFKTRNIKYFYTAYHIIINPDYIAEEIDKLKEKYKLSKNKYHTYKKKTNQFAQDLALNNAKNRKEKSLNYIKDTITTWEDIDIFEGLYEDLLIKNSQTLQTRVDKKYIDHIKKLIAFLIHPKTNTK